VAAPPPRALRTERGIRCRIADHRLDDRQVDNLDVRVVVARLEAVVVLCADLDDVGVRVTGIANHRTT
jgi:hypothetical protein